jgi:hypothetical protein
MASTKKLLWAVPSVLFAVLSYNVCWAITEPKQLRAYHVFCSMGNWARWSPSWKEYHLSPLRSWVLLRGVDWQQGSGPFLHNVYIDDSVFMNLTFFFEHNGNPGAPLFICVMYNVWHVWQFRTELNPFHAASNHWLLSRIAERLIVAILFSKIPWFPGGSTGRCMQLVQLHRLPCFLSFS